MIHAVRWHLAGFAYAVAHVADNTSAALYELGHRLMAPITPTPSTLVTGIERRMAGERDSSRQVTAMRYARAVQNGAGAGRPNRRNGRQAADHAEGDTTP